MRTRPNNGIEFARQYFYLQSFPGIFTIEMRFNGLITFNALSLLFE